MWQRLELPGMADALSHGHFFAGCALVEKSLCRAREKRTMRKLEIQICRGYAQRRRTSRLEHRELHIRFVRLSGMWLVRRRFSSPRYLTFSHCGPNPKSLNLRGCPKIPA